MINYFNLVLDQNDEKMLNPKIASLPEKPKDSQKYGLILKKGSALVKKYPLDNAENVALSFISFEKNRSKLTTEMDKIASTNIAKALDFYKMAHNLVQTGTVVGNTYTIKPKDEIEPYSPIEKKAFAIEIDDIKRLPIDTIDDFNDSMKIFKRDIYKLPAAIKKIASRKFMEKAEEFKVDLSEELKKYASHSLVDTSTMRTMMSSRLRYYPENIKKIATDMIELVKTAKDAMSYIDFTETVDKALKLNKLNHPDLSADFFTEKMDKTAEFYDKLQEGLDNNVLNDYLDEEIIGILKEDPNSFEHFNPNLKQTIKKIINV